MPVLAIRGGEPAMTQSAPDIGIWPLITDEDREAVLGVLEARSMSLLDITREFEKDYAAWIGQEYVLAHSSGTAALHGGMFGLGWGHGDEVITPTWTYWGTHTQLLNVHAVPVFADIQQHSLCLDPEDIEHRITPRTRGIIVVHMMGYPADMDAIMAIAAKHGLQVLEDYSHAHGSRYKGRMCGAIGDAGAASIMSEKPLATGEGGMLNSNRREVWERAVMLGHYERHSQVEDPELQRYAGPAWGGYKYRIHQMTSALGRVQLRHYDENRRGGCLALDRFVSQLADIPGVSSNWPLNNPDYQSNASYAQRIILGDEIIERVPNTVIAEALRAEGVTCSGGGSYCHHLHPFWNEADIYRDGKPTRLFFADRDVRTGAGDCPVAEKINERLLTIPRMTRYDEAYVGQLAAAYRKVLTNLGELEGLTSDAGTTWRRTQG